MDWTKQAYLLAEVAAAAREDPHVRRLSHQEVSGNEIEKLLTELDYEVMLFETGQTHLMTDEQFIRWTDQQMGENDEG